MFKDIFIIQSNEQLHVYNYFNREQIDTINVGDYIEIEPYGEYVVISGEVKLNSITNQLYLCDRNNFICDIEYQKVYETISITRG